MSKTIQQLREARNDVAKKMQHLNAEHKEKWSAEHQTQFDAHAEELTQFDQRIDNEEKLLNLAGEQNFVDAVSLKDSKDSKNALSESAMFRAWAVGGINNLTVEQAAQFANTMSVGGAGSEGGFTVQTDVATTFLVAL